MRENGLSGAGNGHPGARLVALIRLRRAGVPGTRLLPRHFRLPELPPSGGATACRSQLDAIDLYSFKKRDFREMQDQYRYKKGPDSIDAWRFKGFDGNRWIEKAGNVRTSKDYRRGWIQQTLIATKGGNLWTYTVIKKAHGVAEPGESVTLTDVKRGIIQTCTSIKSGFP